MRIITITVFQAMLSLLCISCATSQRVDATKKAEEKILDIKVEAEIEDGELVIYANVRNMLNQPVLMRTKPEKSISIGYDIDYGNKDVDAAGLGGSAWSTVSDTEFIALNGHDGYRSRDFADNYLLRIPIVKRDFKKVKEISVRLHWWSDYFETESGLRGSLNVHMEMTVIPGKKCRIATLEEKVEKEHMKKVPEVAEDKSIPRPYKYDLYKGKGNKPFLDKLTACRKNGRLYVSAEIINPTRDAMLWQVEPCPVIILQNGPAGSHVLPVKLSPLADYEYGFRAIGWEVSSVWNKDILIRWTSDDMKELDVYIRGYYYNATKAKWGVLTERRTVKVEPAKVPGDSE